MIHGFSKYYYEVRSLTVAILAIPTLISQHAFLEKDLKSKEMVATKPMPKG